MKKLSFILVAGLLSVLFFSRNAVSQEKPFVTFEYMRVKPGNDNAYMQVENFWRHIHLWQQKKGDIIAWNVWQVIAPYRLHAGYQYVVVTVYPHFSDYLNAYEGIDMHQIFPDASEDSLRKMFTMTDTARERVSSDIFHVTYFNGNGKNLNYAMVEYAKVSPENEQANGSYMKDHMKPIASDIIKKGFADEWWYGGLMFGHGEKGHYNHVVVYSWENDNMFDKEPPFAQYEKKDPVAFEGYKWATREGNELLHKVVSLESPAK